MNQPDSLNPVPKNVIEEEKRAQAMSFLERVTGRKEIQSKTGTFASITDRLTELHALEQAARPEIDAYLESVDLAFSSLYREICDELPALETKICSDEELERITAKIVAALQTCGVKVEHYEVTDERQAGGWFKVRNGKPLVQYTSFMYLVHETEHFLQWLEVDKNTYLLNRKSVSGDVAEHFAKLTKYYAFKQFGINKKMDATIYQDNYKTDADFLRFQKEADKDTYIDVGLTRILPLVLPEEKEIEVR